MVCALVHLKREFLFRAVQQTKAQAVCFGNGGHCFQRVFEIKLYCDGVAYGQVGAVNNQFRHRIAGIFGKLAQDFSRGAGVAFQADYKRHAEIDGQHTRRHGKFVALDVNAHHAGRFLAVNPAQNDTGLQQGYVFLGGVQVQFYLARFPITPTPAQGRKQVNHAQKFTAFGKHI